MYSFHLPDLGEGLAEAIIREWHVSEGDTIAADTTMVTVETAKAIVEIPAPDEVTIEKIHITPDTTVAVGTKIVSFVSSNTSNTVVGNLDNDEIILSPETPIAIVPKEKSSAKITNHMASVMENSKQTVVPATLCDEAILFNWDLKDDISARIIQALIIAVKKVPKINGHFCNNTKEISIKNDINIGLAVQTENNLFFPTLVSANELRGKDMIRSSLNKIKSNPTALQKESPSIFLSNIGSIAGTFSTPVVIPPCIAIIATGKIKEQVVAINGEIKISKVMPISISFDHRALSGADVANFLGHFIADLSLNISAA